MQLRMSKEELFNGVTSLKNRFYSFNNFSQIVRERKDIDTLSLINMFRTHFTSKIVVIYAYYDLCFPD